MHTKEWRRSSNTGHLLRLSTPNVKIQIYGRRNDLADASDWIDERETRPLVLYPTGDSIKLSRDFSTFGNDPRPITLIVPDGTWSQARHIAKRVKGLDAFPHVALPRPPEVMMRPRRNIGDDRMSTYEAVAQALTVLEDDGLEVPFSAFFHQVAARMLCMRGRVSRQDVDALTLRG